MQTRTESRGELPATSRRARAEELEPQLCVPAAVSVPGFDPSIFYSEKASKQNPQTSSSNSRSHQS